MKTFIRKKLIKGHEYLYEVTPYLDPDSGKWKQKSRYLGKNVGGEPVRKEKPDRPGQVFDLGQYIPAYWAIHEYKILEALISCCSPVEAATLVVLAINRLIQPCPPRHLASWYAGTCIPHLIPGSDLNAEEVSQTLQNVSDTPVTGMFARMFSLINHLSDQRVLMTLQGRPSCQTGISSTGPAMEGCLERDLMMRLHYDPVMKIPVGCDFFAFQKQSIEDSIDQVTSGHIPGGIILPNWDYMSPSLIPRIIQSECPFIIKTDLGYSPVGSHISSSGGQVYHSANIRHYQGQACYIRPFTPVIGGLAVKGYLLHNIRKEQADRIIFHKNLQNVRDLIQEMSQNTWIAEDMLDQTAGPFRCFFTREESGGIAMVRRNEETISRALMQFGKDGVLYHGDLSWEICFTLADLRSEIEVEINGYISQFERDYAMLRTDRIRTGIYFVSFLTLLLRHLIENRLASVKIHQISSFEALIAELTPIHLVKGTGQMIAPGRLKREQKIALSFFGGIPSLLEV